jgi:beta-glucan synthesis-associated protein KRE6
MYNTSASHYNTYKGGAYQQAISCVSDLPNTSYNGTGYSTYAFEYWGNRNDRDQSYITWFVDGVKTWNAPAGSVPADPISGVSNRLIPEEPMVRSL